MSLLLNPVSATSACTGGEGFISLSITTTGINTTHMDVRGT